MDDQLIQSERIQQAIELGESQFREFKSALRGAPEGKSPREPRDVAKDISETLVAFANADGGELLIGVEDDGTITGVDYNFDSIEKLLSSPKTGVHTDTPLDSPVSKRVDVEGKLILYFSIEKGTRQVHQTSDGRCLQRRDRENLPVTFERLRFERQEQLSREYDRQFVDGAQVRDLNLELISRVSEQVTKTRMSNEKFLQFLGLAEYYGGNLRIRRAAILLFANDIGRWHPRCQVRILRARGLEIASGRDYNVTSDETSTGNILELISKAWDHLREHLVETKMGVEGLFKTRVMYPESACQEALVNAITHRDYSLEGQNIEIQVYDDRMEVISPGGLLSTIRLDDLKRLKGAHESRNAFVARVLREIGYVREMGEGMRRIFRLLNDADLVAPQLLSEFGRFKIILNNRSVFSEQDQKWLDGYKPLKINRTEMQIALLGKNGTLLSPQEIYEALHLVDWDEYRKIVDTIQAKSIVYNTLTEQSKIREANKLKQSKRSVKRLAVRQPDECEKALSDAYAALQRLGAVDYVSTTYIDRVLGEMSPENPLRTNSHQFVKFLRALDLIDEHKKPATPLTNLWGKPDDQRRFPPARPKSVAPSHSTSQQVARGGVVNAQTTLFVGNVDYFATTAELEQLFSPFGTVVSSNIPRDFVTLRGRGFAFVSMADRASANRAMQELNGTEFRGRIIRISWGN